MTKKTNRAKTNPITRKAVQGMYEMYLENKTVREIEKEMRMFKGRLYYWFNKYNLNITTHKRK